MSRKGHTGTTATPTYTNQTDDRHTSIEERSKTGQSGVDNGPEDFDVKRCEFNQRECDLQE